MPSTREIRRRIRSVKNISQVTRAMQMVAASKMRRAQEQVLATRPYTEKAWQVLSNLAAQRGVDETIHPLLQISEEIKTVGMVLVTSDKGLCGSYNHNMIQAASRFINELPYPVELVTVGRRGRDAMWRMRKTIVAEFSELPPQPRLLDITPITPTDNSEPEITGGYIWKKDSMDPWDEVFTTDRGQELQMVDPKPRDVTDQQVQ